MAISLSDNILIKTTAPSDARWGEYVGSTEGGALTAALSAIQSSYRYEGLTVGLKIGNNIITEYWFSGGIADINLVLKTSASVDLSSKVTAVNSSLTGIYVLTQTEYDNLVSIDPSILYMIKNA